MEVSVVLVRPIYERNVGACSRAMSNMGFERLILIQRQCELTFEAQKAAATGQKALQNRIEYANWNQFFEGEGDSLRLAFSARSGKLRPLFPARDWLRKWRMDERAHHVETPRKVHLIFGTEDSGLSNEDVDFVHANLLLPVFGENPSLNLAMAVLLACSMVQEEWNLSDPLVPPYQDPPRRVESSPYFPPQRLDESLRIWLENLGFDLEDRRVSVHSVMKRLLFHNVPSEKELRTLSVVLEQARRKSNFTPHN